MIWAKITTIFDIRKFYELNFAKIKISGVTRLSALNKDGVFLSLELSRQSLVALFVFLPQNKNFLAIFKNIHYFCIKCLLFKALMQK